jgi:hypothetical protein
MKTQGEERQDHPTQSSEPDHSLGRHTVRLTASSL